MIAQLIFGLLLAGSLLAQTQVELTKQVKGELPPEKGGTGVSSCLENEGLVWQSGEFACSALASGPHAPTHQDGGADEVGSASPASNAIRKAGAGGRLAEAWLPTTVSQDMTWTGAHDFKKMNGVLVSTAFDWSQSPGGTLAIGPNTLSLAPCPSGVSGTNTNHYLYISGGAGSAEAVLITGGTCVADGASGTMEFVSANAHSGAWQIGSATAGIQEAIWSLDVPGNDMPDGGIIRIPPGEYKLYQTLTIGNGTASIASLGNRSDITFVALHGAGGGEESNAPGFNFTTNLEWNGPAAGKMIVVRGEIRGIKISDLRVGGNNTSGDLLTLFACKFCSFKNLGLGHGGPDRVGIQLHSGTVGSVFEGVRVTQQNDGATGWAFGLGANPNHLGVTQNTLIRCKASFAGNKGTSYGYVFEGADNNTVLQSTAVGNKALISDATNATPIVITTAVNHLRQTGDTVTIIGVNGNTAANGTFIITKLTESTFSLDGSSGNGAYALSGIVWGPGHALRFITVSGSNFPKENAFYNSAFFSGYISSTGGHRGNWFFPFATGDQEILPANTGSNRIHRHRRVRWLHAARFQRRSYIEFRSVDRAVAIRSK